MKIQQTIRNCPLPVFKKVCPQQWEALAPTSQSGVRHCAQCDRDVHFCSDDKETITHARAGHCIARSIPDESELPTRVSYVGLALDIQSIQSTPQQEEALRMIGHERAVTDALKNLNAPRSCPNCQFPIHSWRKNCYVCHTKIEP